MATWRQYIESGARMAYVYHVAGMDWAATTDQRLADWLSANGASEFTRALFGIRAVDAAAQVFACLDPDLGQQTISSTKDGGIDVGSWQVRVAGGADGYQFGRTLYGDFATHQDGFCGLNWQPDYSTRGIVYGELSQSLITPRDGGLTNLYWRKQSGNGLKQWLESGSGPAVKLLWVGSSCLICAPMIHETDDGESYYIEVTPGHFGTPLEDLYHQGRIVYQVANAPIEMAGRTARLFAVPINELPDGSIEIIDADRLPIMLRTGKVQPGAQCSDGAFWTVQHCGFTSQLKYTGAVGDYRAQIAGYSLTRATPIDSNAPWYSAYNDQGVCQAPHIVLHRFLGSGGVKTYPRAGKLQGVTRAGIGGSITVDTFNGQDAIKVTCYAGQHNNGIVIPGARPGYSYKVTGSIYMDWFDYGMGKGSEFLRTNTGGGMQERRLSTLYDGMGFDLTLHNPTAIEQSIMIATSPAAPPGGGTIWVSDLRVEETHPGAEAIWLCNPGGAVWYHDWESLRDAALAALNDATGDQFALAADGDIVCVDDGVACFLGGPVPYILGLGWIDQGAEHARQMMETLATQPGAYMFYSQPLGKRMNAQAPPVFYYDCTDPTQSVALGTSSAHAPRFVYSGLKTPRIQAVGDAARYIRNQSRHAYYLDVHRDFSPLTTASGRRISMGDGHYSLMLQTQGIVPLSAGDQVSLGAGAWTRITGDGQNDQLWRALGILGYEVKAPVISGMISEHAVAYMQHPRAWCTGWADWYVETGTQLSDGIDGELSFNDPNPVALRTAAMSDDPTSLIMQMLGAPLDISGGEINVPPSLQCTTIPDLFDDITGRRQLIDWESLRAAITSFGLAGVGYGVAVPQSQSEGDNGDDAGLHTVDILSALRGLCQTHAVSMQWGYDDVQRSWVLSFRPEALPVLAAAVLEGKVLDRSAALPSVPTQITGASMYSYSGVKASYRRTDGVAVQLNIKDPSGRAAHSNAATQLEITDTMTRITAGQDGAVVDRLAASFGARLQSLSHLLAGTTVGGSIATAGYIDVGGQCAIETGHIRNPVTGMQGDHIIAAAVTQMQIMLGRTGAQTRITVAPSRIEMQGISPSLFVDTWSASGSKITVTGLATDPADNDFAPKDGGLTDLATFGCWSYSQDGGLRHRDDCGCGDYACLLWPRHVDATVPLNVATLLRCTAHVDRAAIESGTLTLTMTGGVLTAGRKYVLMFERRESAALQPCQTRLYGWLGNDDDVVLDADGYAHDPIRVGQ